MFFTYEAEQDYYFDAFRAYSDAVKKVNRSGTAKYTLTEQGNAVCVRDKNDESPINLRSSSVVREGV